MNENLQRLIWLIPSSFLFGFIYGALRTSSTGEFVRHGLKQSVYVVLGMGVLGLVIYWMSRNL